MAAGLGADEPLQAFETRLRVALQLAERGHGDVDEIEADRGSLAAVAIHRREACPQRSGAASR